MKQDFLLWPYFALALVSGVVGATLLFYNLGAGLPPEAELQKVSGDIDKVFLIDDLSGEPIMIKKPMNSLHFTLKDVPGEFRYPSDWPGFTKAWQRLSFHVDVWVRQSDIGSGKPMPIYRLEQQVPENWAREPIAVSYAQIAESQGRSSRSYVKLGTTLLAASAGLVLFALLVRAWNRRQRKDDLT